MNNVNKLCKQLKDVADTVNSFKSESIQVRVIDYILNNWTSKGGAENDNPTTPHIQEPIVSQKGKLRNAKRKLVQQKF